ncbi:hypothetical protein M0813_21493 [Anaeramoeba flamelloides]|uniref:Uncharacterized protein n=1 Tax=Anaeramoeba flamelloides TaxID=1746091 RepID=A0ABQ8YI97_9EUKA|nr:hypothetical protein M0813_21493 [Anaeramoeba flamelloides]
MISLDFNQTHEIVQFASRILSLKKPSRLFIQPRTQIETKTLILKPKKNKNNHSNGKNQTISRKELTSFLNSKPQPKWSEKLKMIKKYNPSLITNCQPLCDQKHQQQQKPTKKGKIIIQKKTIKLIVELSVCHNTHANEQEYLKKYSQSQKSLVNYLKSNGFEKQKSFNKDKLLFQMYQNRKQM